ncbi:MAG: hypothetical protein M3134_10040 [Actinomycetota bacterium]|nr:hypothetical protein [Actinomycetota bacterium]
MLSVLKDIFCAIVNLPIILADWLVALFNALIAAIGAVLVFALGLLPAMPDPPAAVDSEVLGYANWLFPIGGVLDGLVIVGVLFVGFLGVRVLLNWAKALRS